MCSAFGGADTSFVLLVRLAEFLAEFGDALQASRGGGSRLVQVGDGAGEFCGQPG